MRSLFLLYPFVCKETSQTPVTISPAHSLPCAQGPLNHLLCCSLSSCHDLYKKYHGGLKWRQTQDYHLGLPTRLTLQMSVCEELYIPVCLPGLRSAPESSVKFYSGWAKGWYNSNQAAKNLTVGLKATQALYISLKCKATKIYRSSTAHHY